MPSVTRRKAADRDRRQAVEQDVLDAVERLLAAGESFTALPIQRIADEAGIGRSTFYGRFADKPTLLIALTDAATKALFARAAAFVQDDESTREQHVGVVYDLVQEYRLHEALLRAVIEVAAYEPEIEAFWQSRVDAFASLIEARLIRDRAAGRMVVPVDPGPTASWIAWGTERVLAAHVRREPPAADRAFAEAIAGTTWATMGRGAG